ncbi:hypothetical protein V6N11_067729 [Hibiscus sabdariffa]|uniref:Uncharacterized protein n=1 Tax=Hibiscus sabdariffa TaxID=183260 RepID=A0ABR2SSK7_9ROSI
MESTPSQIEAINASKVVAQRNESLELEADGESNAAIKVDSLVGVVVRYLSNTTRWNEEFSLCSRQTWVAIQGVPVFA